MWKRKPGVIRRTKTLTMHQSRRPVLRVPSKSSVDMEAKIPLRTVATNLAALPPKPQVLLLVLKTPDNSPHNVRHQRHHLRAPTARVHPERLVLLGLMTAKAPQALVTPLMILETRAPLVAHSRMERRASRPVHLPLVCRPPFRL